MSKAKILELNVYPIKSCQGVSLKKMDFLQAGPALDRQWMVVDENGKFLTQRQIGVLAQVETMLTDKELIVKIERSQFHLPIEENLDSCREVQVWSSQLKAQVESDEINRAFSDLLNQKVQLVRYGKESKRERHGFETRFTDAYPLLLVNKKSHEDLVKRIGQEIPINRFRANLIVDADTAFAEDRWQYLSHPSGLQLKNAGPCVRCVVTTKDQQSGSVMGPEPLKTLATFRRNSDGVIFGINMIHSGLGSIQVGDFFEVQSSN